MKATALLCLFLLPACSYMTTTRLKTYDAAKRLGQTVESCPVFYAGSLPADLPTIVPYLEIAGDFPPGSSMAYAGRKYLTQARRYGYGADVLVCSGTSPALAGSVGQHIGFGVVISQPVYRDAGRAWCCRLAPVSVGAKWDERGMVTWVDDRLRSAAGIIEGDMMETVNGCSVKASSQAGTPYDELLLSMKPGDPIAFEWIRPGTGRMSAKSVALEPLPMTKAVCELTKEAARQAEKARAEDARITGQ